MLWHGMEFQGHCLAAEHRTVDLKHFTPTTLGNQATPTLASTVN